MRLFYASFLSSENMVAYEALVAEVSAAIPKVLRPIPPKTHHLTMAFLGELDRQDLDGCLEALEAVEESPAIDYSLAEPRILFARRTPRLICTDATDGAEQITSVQRKLRAAFVQRFPSFRLRVQSPHITLARFKRNAHPRSAKRVSEALSVLDESRLPRADRLESVHLVQSTLTSSGPVYESLGKVGLGDSETRQRAE